MSVREQVFEAPVHGDVAGRDVVKTVHVHVYTAAQSEGSRHPESEQLRKSKELMPPVCHSELEWLEQHSDVPSRLVFTACKAGALDCKDGHLVRGKFMPDYVLCAVMIAVVWLFGTLSAWAWLAYKSQLSQFNQFILFGITASCVIAVWWLQHQFLYPHQTARKAVFALQMRNYGKDPERPDSESSLAG